MLVWRLAVLPVALLAASVLVVGTASIPHVSQCGLCFHCHLGDKPPDGASTASEDAADPALPRAAATQSGARRLTSQGVRSQQGPDPGYTRSTGNDGADASSSNNDVDHSHADDSSRSIRAGRSTLTSGSQPSQRRRAVKRPVYDPELDPTVPLQYKPSSYRPTSPGAISRLPNCTECYGCEHTLEHISDNTTFLNITYANERGASQSWIFRTRAPSAPSGWAVVKVYCLPLAKRPGGRIPLCKPDRIVEIMRHLMAIDKLSVECGFTDIIPRMWLAPVKAIVPGFGYPISWYGLWMDYVEGVSLENFLHKGQPKRAAPGLVADLFNRRLNRTRVVRGAIFDLLTSQCDRHAQNVFMQEDGNIVLIDNESCLQHMWLNCGFDSILLPTTQKQEIVRLANHYVLKLPGAETVPPAGGVDPQLLLDYRCWAEGGALGTAYPEQVQTCLARIAGMTHRQVKNHFGFPEIRVAGNLQVRALDMITKGYEWAVKYGRPQNAQPKRYRLQPPCCSLVPDRFSYKCGHPWKPSLELPVGNPTNGRVWDKERRDIGSYEGGTHPEDSPEFVARGVGAELPAGAGAAGEEAGPEAATEGGGQAGGVFGGGSAVGGGGAGGRRR